jgi:hypothetical protein
MKAAYPSLANQSKEEYKEGIAFPFTKAVSATILQVCK